VLKPSHATPLASLLMARCMQECGLPESIYQVVVGGAELGEMLIDTADMIMFTGSTAVGKKVMQRAAERLLPVSLELGGKDPMIVLADADVERAADSAVYGAMQNAGQTCISVERVYVEEPVYDSFVNAVTKRVAALRQGVSERPAEYEVGAMTTEQQIETVEQHVEQARAAGATVTVGGRRHASAVGGDDGTTAAGSKRRTGAGGEEQSDQFFEPTVLTGVNHDMLCMTEETFGPTLPIMRVNDVQQAIALANDSPYGLSASVWTGDTRRGEAIARQLDAGAVDVNDVLINYSALELPMGGWKQSGVGRRHGPDGIRKYCRQQSLLISGRLRPPELHTFPYRRRKTLFLRRLLRFLYGRGAN
jgi:acyl-CoA reductase-like NAD-dependent aldehyde dehydrogenase